MAPILLVWRTFSFGSELAMLNRFGALILWQTRRADCAVGVNLSICQLVGSFKLKKNPFTSLLHPSFVVR